jgi:hypothetical protein
MTTPLDLARQELAAGVREPAAFARYSGGRDEAWCAHFVSWLFDNSGLPLPGYFKPFNATGGLPPTAGCNYLMKRMREFGRILPEGAEPQPNDLIFYKHRDGGQFTTPGLYGFPVIYGHVGLVEGVETDPKTGQKYVITIEGNYSNKVARVRTKLTDPSIGAFARPVDFGAVAIGAGTLLASALGVYAVWRYKKR